MNNNKKNNNNSHQLLTWADDAGKKLYLVANNFAL